MSGLLQSYSVITEPECGSKEMRAEAFAAQCKNGMVKLVEQKWNKAFIDELCSFPLDAHDDQVDAASAALRALNRGISYYATSGISQVNGDWLA
jgi:predicted phage terminase large subunit-like protein